MWFREKMAMPTTAKHIASFTKLNAISGKEDCDAL
jgi:hypothetical protein